MKASHCATLLSFLFLPLTFAGSPFTLLLTEDFNTDGEGSRYTSSSFDDGGSDFFERLTANPEPRFLNGLGFTAPAGAGYWGSEDIDEGGAPNPLGDHGIVRLDDLNVAGFSNLQVRLFLATTQITRFDIEDIIEVQVAADANSGGTDLTAGSYTTIGRFIGNAPDIFGSVEMKQDSDLDGLVFGDPDDAASPTLNSAMQEFVFNVPFSASTLSVQVRIEQDGGSEEIAFDHIRVEGILSSNDAPVISGIEGPAIMYTEGDPATQVTNTLAVSDTDDTDLESATVKITAGLDPSEDLLAVGTPPGGSVVNYTAGTGTLTITGTASLAAYQTALRSVTYENTDSVNPSTAIRTIQFQVNDGTDNSNFQARNVQITGTIGSGTIPHLEDFDVDGEGLTYTSSTYRLADDFFERSITNPAPNHSGGFVFTAPQAGSFWAAEDVDSAGNPLGDHGIVRLQNLDASGLSNLQVRIFLAQTSSTFDLNDQVEIQYAVDGDIPANPTDLSSGSYATIGRFIGDTVDQFGDGPLKQDSDLDGVVNGDPDDAASSTLSPTMTEYIFSIPATGNDLSVQIRIAQNGGMEELAFDHIQVTGDAVVGTPPTLANVDPSPLVFLEGDPDRPIIVGVTVSDPDASQIASATAQITGNFDAGEDILGDDGSVPAGIVVAPFDTGTGTLSLSGTASPADYQAALRAITYGNTDATNPSPANRTVSFQAIDGDGNPSNTVTRDIDVIPSIDPGSLPLVETFDTDGNGVRYTASAFNTGGLNSFFERVTANPDPRHADGGFPGFTFTPPQGDAYFASEDVEHPSNPLGDHGIIRLRDLDVTGASGIKVRVFLAESAPNSEGPEDKIEIQYALDGNTGGSDLTAGTYTTIGRFVPDSPDEFTTGPMTLDRDLDGVTNGDGVDDAPAAVLTTTMQEFEFDIPATGNLLSVQVRVAQNGASEELAIDHITVVAPLPGPLLVTTDVDEDDGNPGPLSGAGTSLREAILAANLAPGPDVINFSDGTGGTTNFFGGAAETIAIAGLGGLEVNEDLTINGPGSNRVTIDGGDTVRGIDITTATAITFSGLTIRNGNAGSEAGGGIRIGAPAAAVAYAFTDVDVRDCTATESGGIDIISSAGSFTFEDLEITGNTATGNVVGGIWLHPTGAGLELDRVTIDDNETISQAGGAAFQLAGPGTLVIRDSTISRNRATGDDMGAMFIGGPVGVPMTIVNTTISGNEAGGDAGAIWASSGELTITNSTVTGNTCAGTGGGLLNAGALVAVNNSLIAGNTAPTNPDLFGTFASNGFNFIGDPGSATGFGADKTFATTGTVLEDVLDPALTDFGGPTLVHRLVQGSPAIDMGNTPDAVDENAAPLATDQRGAGFPRAVGASVDIGAFESAPPTVVLNAADAGAGSLREALATTPNGGFITFDLSLNGGIIILTSGELFLSKGLEIDASALSRGLTVSGDNSSRVFFIFGESSTTLKKLTIVDGISSSGGGIFANADLTLEDCHLARNTATSAGGGIYQSDGTLNIRRSTLSGNAANSSGGGGIRSIGTSSILRVQNSTITGNRARFAGGISSRLGEFSLIHSTVAENTGSSGTGGVVMEGGSATIGNSIIAANKGQNTSDDDIGGASTSVTVAGPNLIGSNNSNYAGFFPFDGMLIGNLSNPVDPQLAPLSEYGGCTPTMQPLALSPAFDNGTASAATPATDQRGLPRTVNGGPDLGAVESGPAFTVTNTSDTGAGSLRQAIIGAAGTAGARIYFAPASFPATINFAGQIALSAQHVFIDASNLPGPVVLDGASGTRLFLISSNSVVGLANLQLRNADPGAVDGGAVRTSGSDFTAYRATFADNAAGGHGAAIFLFGGGSVNFHDSLVANNISGNLGGGIMSFSGDVTTVNTTFTGNQAGGGGAMWVQGASATNLTHTTITANTASQAVVSFGTNTIENTIIAGNSATNLAGVGTTTFRGNNLLVGDPLLAPLSDFGGPTLSMRPLPGSPAIDGAVLLGTSPCTDQRGAPRPLGFAPDIGAVELVSIIVNTAADENDGILAGDISLRDAVGHVATPPVELVTFDPAVFPAAGTITLSPANGNIAIADRAIAIDAADIPGGVTVSGGDAIRHFDLSGFSNDVLMRSLTLTDGAGNPGGAIRNADGTLSLNEVSLIGNTTTGRGGAIIINSGTVTVQNSTISGNTAGDVGGAISNNGTLTLINSTLTGNTADGSTGQAFGGAIFNFDVPLTLIHCTVTGNSAPTFGGGIRPQGGTVTLENTIVADNTSGTGPDIAKSGTVFIVNGANLIGNNHTIATEFPAGALTGTPGDPLSPALAPLADFGGATATMPPLPGSLVIESAVTLGTSPPNDQRGFLRPNGPLPDIGATEAFAFSTIPLVDSDNDGIDDRLEPAYPQFTVGVDDSGLDSDGDGRPDGVELGDMTDPLDPNDFVMITSFAPAAGFDPVSNPLFNVTVKTFPGLSYELQSDTAVDSFLAIPGSGFTAGAFSQDLQTFLNPNSDFLRAKRTP